jgi:hypothetical protein
MKKIQKYLLCLTLMATLAMFATSCSEKEFSEDYDIPWVVSTITGVTPLTAAPGTPITITGTNLSTEWVPPSVMGQFCFDGGGFEICIPTGLESSGVTIGTALCEIVSQTDTQIVILAPGGFSTTKPVDIWLINLHNRTFVYSQQFTPIL